MCLGRAVRGSAGATRRAKGAPAFKRGEELAR